MKNLRQRRREFDRQMRRLWWIALIASAIVLAFAFWRIRQIKSDLDEKVDQLRPQAETRKAEDG